MKKKHLYGLLFSVLLLLLVTAGASYAWFARNASMATLVEIMPPDVITIVPVSDDGNTWMEELDLDFREGDKQEGKTITIRRPVCIRSTSRTHRLEIAHTTNLSGLKFQLYPATKGNTSISYDQNSRINGRYVNPNSNNNELAEPELLENYREDETIEEHAYPLYWITADDQTTTDKGTDEFDPVSGAQKKFYYTYYILEISWIEETKETDLFYIMAYNVA